jgi:hypothetical protein
VFDELALFFVRYDIIVSWRVPFSEVYRNVLVLNIALVLAILMEAIISWNLFFYTVSVVTFGLSFTAFSLYYSSLVIFESRLSVSAQSNNNNNYSSLLNQTEENRSSNNTSGSLFNRQCHKCIVIRWTVIRTNPTFFSTIRVNYVPKHTILDIMDGDGENGYVKVEAPEMYCGWIKKNLLLPVPSVELVAVGMITSFFLRRFFS